MFESIPAIIRIERRARQFSSNIAGCWWSIFCGQSRGAFPSRDAVVSLNDAKAFGDPIDTWLAKAARQLKFPSKIRLPEKTSVQQFTANGTYLECQPEIGFLFVLAAPLPERQQKPPHRGPANADSPHRN